MRRSGLLATAAAAAVMFGPALGSAHAAAPELGASHSTCSGQLRLLETKTATLDDLRGARAKGEVRRTALRTSASDLAGQIAGLRTSGGSVAMINTLHGTRAKVLSDLQRSLRLAPMVAAQIDALQTDVEASSRRYIACVEASLAP